jgi:hypothetical protein
MAQSGSYFFDSEMLSSTGAAQSPDDITLKAAELEFEKLPWEAVASTFEYIRSGHSSSDLSDFLSRPCQPITVEDNSDCLWTSLREALVHAGVSTLEDDLRKEIMKFSQEALSKEGLNEDQDPWESRYPIAKMKKYLLVRCQFLSLRF